MAVNKNALIRYKTIDKCLQNRYRLWTLEDLIDACSDALYEYEGIDKGVSKRTVQADIQIMRSDKLGYNAPIIVVDKKHYQYEEDDYSITNIPITTQDLKQLTDAVHFLKQFQGFSHFRELDSMVQKLEDHVYSQKNNSSPVIDFEKNDNLKGIEFLDQLYTSIIAKKLVELTYQSFKARQASTFTFKPLLLKEFRNRWFIVGYKKGSKSIFNLALDRIIDAQTTEIPFTHAGDFNPETHFKNAIGVSVNEGMTPEKIVLYLSRKHAPYILTKPLHKSQQVIKEDYYGVTIQLDVVHNFELEKEILSYGEEVKVIEPARLRRTIEDRLQASIDRYQTDLSSKLLQSIAKKVEWKGTAIVNRVLTNREIRKIKSVIEKVEVARGQKLYGERNLFHLAPELKALVLNKNILQLIKTIDSKAKLVKAIFFDKQTENNWLVNWHQDLSIQVTEKVETVGYKSWTIKNEVIGVIPPVDVLKQNITIRIHLDEANENNGALKVLPGSHKSIFSQEETALITENSSPQICVIPAGGVHIFKPLILHSSSKSKTTKRRRVIHLEFSSVELSNGLEWVEQ